MNKLTGDASEKSKTLPLQHSAVKERAFSTFRDKRLYTPGPLTTSANVKAAALHDLGSRDYDFMKVVQRIRNSLVDIALQNSPAAATEYQCILLPGSGTYGIEAVIASTIPPQGKLLILGNGAYGKRIKKIALTLKIDCLEYWVAEDQLHDLQKIKKILQEDHTITNVAVVHCETTTGIINPIQAIGEIVANHSNAKFFVDAMSSFAAIPIHLKDFHIDFLVSSANKCLEGIPGFSFILAKTTSLSQCKDYARSFSFDLYDQWKNLEESGQFRFTPPTHALLSFAIALDEFFAEGGVDGRSARYLKNYHTLIEGMRRIGFKEYLPRERQGYIITAFLYPQDVNFSFETFYQKLNHKGFVIYPGKLGDGNCFRIGHIGQLTFIDMQELLQAIEHVLNEMKVSKF